MTGSMASGGLHTDPSPLGRSSSSQVWATLVLLTVISMRFWGDISSPGLLDDERSYAESFQCVARGEAPYCAGGFFYLPAFSVTGAWLEKLMGEQVLFLALRAASLTAVAWTVWTSVSLLTLSFALRLMVASVLLISAPGVALGVATGNLSFLAIGLTLWALLHWRRRPVIAGSLFAIALLVKPLAPVSLPLLLAHRPAKPGRQHIRCGLVGVALAAALMSIGGQYWDDFLELRSSAIQQVFPMTRTVSLQRLLSSLGLELDAIVIAGGVTLLALLLARRQLMDCGRILCVALATTTLATPGLWSHSLIVTLPLQILSLDAALRRWREAGPAASVPTQAVPRRARYELAGIVVAILAIQFCDGVGAFTGEPSIWLALALAPPCLAPTALALYILRHWKKTPPLPDP